jgi:drug/metabolite transporter (DMT)-like permease
VCVRSDPERDWWPALPGYAALMIVVCVIVTLSNGNTLLPPARDTSYALLHGAVFIVVGTLLFNAASRTVPAVAMTIFAQTETVFVPMWVFLVLDEQPKAATLLGGAIILTAIIGKGVLDARPANEHVVEPGPGSIA